MIRGWLRAAAVMAAALACSLPHAARALETVPFAFDDGTIRVQGTVNGRALPMRIDLGAGIDVLSQSVGSRNVNVTSKFVTLTSPASASICRSATSYRWRWASLP